MKKIEIELDVKNKKHFVSRYNDDVVEPKLIEYLYNYLIGKSIKSKVVIKIRDNFGFSKKEMGKYILLIRNEIKENIDELNDELYSTIKNNLLLLFAGSFLISLSYVIDYIHLYTISQIITVFGWVVLWEVAYSMIFGSSTNRKMIKRYKQLYDAEIKFI